jgi:hypothetical protein
MEAIEEAAKVAQDLLDKEAATDKETRTSLGIVKKFIQTNRVICYGGTAINNLLPKEDQFYDPSKDVPDYDFFSETPQLHAMKIADILDKAGFENVEVKPGMHIGTFKVFCDFVGVADVSHLEPKIFKKLWDESVIKNGIHYVPPDFLRMSVYLELSRPRGDVSRWKKVYSRLQLLNKHYPVKCKSAHPFERNPVASDVKTKIAKIIKKSGSMVLGFNAAEYQRKAIPGEWAFPIDILALPEKREEVAKEIQQVIGEQTKKEDFPEFAELFPPHTDIDHKNKTLVRVYDTFACHSYHETYSGLRVASIPTLLQFIFAALYAPDHYLEEIPRERFICVAQKLVDLANGEGPRRYKLLTPIACIGKQKTLTDMKAEKSELYTQLKNSPKFLEVFFTYNPSKDKTKKQSIRARLRKTLKK